MSFRDKASNCNSARWPHVCAQSSTMFLRHFQKTSWQSDTKFHEQQPELPLAFSTSASSLRSTLGSASLRLVSHLRKKFARELPKTEIFSFYFFIIVNTANHQKPSGIGQLPACSCKCTKMTLLLMSVQGLRTPAFSSEIEKAKSSHNITTLTERSGPACHRSCDSTPRLHGNGEHLTQRHTQRPHPIPAKPSLRPGQRSIQSLASAL